MKRAIILATILLASSGALTKSQSSPPLFIGMGDSLGEGVQSADASTRTQPFSYLNLVGQQLGVTFPLPLIQSGPTGIVGETKNRSRVQASLVASNLAVSGADVDSLLNLQAGTPISNETDLVLAPRTGSQMQIAESLQSPWSVRGTIWTARR
jgi:hypothetical protein